jgi:hypothetical protein
MKKLLLVLLLAAGSPAVAQPPPGFWQGDMGPYFGTIHVQACVAGVWPLCVWVKPRHWGQVCYDGGAESASYTWVRQNRIVSWFLRPTYWWCSGERKGSVSVPFFVGD